MKLFTEYPKCKVLCLEALSILLQLHNGQSAVGLTLQQTQYIQISSKQITS